jgi:two-component system response regulator NreC
MDVAAMTPRIRVLLADDHAVVREGLRALFTTIPEYEVVADVGDVDATMAGVRSAAPDLVVLDLAMPKTGGLAAIRQIKAERPNTAIVVLTRYADLAFVREALRAGATAYVLKQSSFGELQRAALLAINGEQYVDTRLKPSLDRPVPDAKGQVSTRERDVLRRTVLGQSNKEIATALGIAVKTVEVHKANGMRKLDLPDRRALVRYAAIQGWLVEP